VVVLYPRFGEVRRRRRDRRIWEASTERLGYICRWPVGERCWQKGGENCAPSAAATQVFAGSSLPVVWRGADSMPSLCLVGPPASHTTTTPASKHRQTWPLTRFRLGCLTQDQKWSQERLDRHIDPMLPSPSCLSPITCTCILAHPTEHSDHGHPLSKGTTLCDSLVSQGDTAQACQPRSNTELIAQQVTQQAMSYAIRSGIAITSTYALKQCGRLLKVSSILIQGIVSALHINSGRPCRDVTGGKTR
jgi:hypothetical protein